MENKMAEDHAESSHVVISRSGYCRQSGVTRIVDTPQHFFLFIRQV